MENLPKTPYHTIHKERLNERRLLSYHGRGFNKDFIKNLEKDLGLSATIERLKEIKKEVKNDTFRQLAKKQLMDSFATYN